MAHESDNQNAFTAPGIRTIKTTDEKGQTISEKEMEKKAQMADAQMKLKSKASDIILDIYDIIEKDDERKAKLQEKTGNFFVDMKRKINQLTINLTRIRLQEKVMFFQLLSVMIYAGIPVVRALMVLAEQIENPRFKIVIARMSRMVERGKSFSEAMVEFHTIFTEAQIGMIEAAEASGQMNEVLRQLADEMEKRARITSRVRGAMVYPGVIFSVLVVVAVLMMILVVPKLTVLFSESAANLPWPTRLLIFTSDALTKYWFISLFIIIAIGVAIYIWKRTEEGKYHYDLFKIHIPILGKLQRKLALSRFARGLGNLLHAGLPIVKAIMIDANSIGNEVYRERIELAAEDVKRGIPLGDNLSADKKLFPTMVAHMILVGEQTAQLDVVCNKIADFYDEEVDVLVGSLTRVMEPLIMIIVGVGVAFMVAAIMMPMLQLIDIAAVL